MTPPPPPPPDKFGVQTSAHPGCATPPPQARAVAGDGLQTAAGEGGAAPRGLDSSAHVAGSRSPSQLFSPSGRLKRPPGGAQKKEDLCQSLRLVIPAPPEGGLRVCPFLIFRMEYAFAVDVDRVAADREVSGGLRVTGSWRCTRAVGLAQMATESWPVQLTLVSGEDGEGPVVVAAAGPGSFGRCAAERWFLAATNGTHPARGSAWTSGVASGATLRVQRPASLAHVLRKPELQLARLLVQLGEEHGARLLAAPTGSGSVAVLAASPGPLLPPAVLSELEARFGVLLEEPAAEQVVPVEEANEVILQRLVEFSLSAALQGQGWAAVEHTTRLCRSEVLARGGAHTTALRHPALQMPSVDVHCVSAQIGPSGLSAEVTIVPAVQSVQPVGLHLARVAKNPKLAGPYRQEICEGLCGASLPGRPVAHVLPALSQAELTHVWLDGLPPRAADRQEMGLPPDLDSPEAMSRYWRLIHGYRLPHEALRSFARVVFPRAGLQLTYPLACLWRSCWVPQPMLTSRVAPLVLQTALDSVRRLNLLGAGVCVELAEGSLAAAACLPAASLGPLGVEPPTHVRTHVPKAAPPAPTPQPRLLPQSRALATHALATPAEPTEPEAAASDQGLAEQWQVAAAQASRKGKRLLLAPPSLAAGLPAPREVYGRGGGRGPIAPPMKRARVA